MLENRVSVAVKMTFRGDDLTTPATPDTSQAPQQGFPGSHPYTCVGRWAGIGGLADGPTDGGWAFAHQFAQPDHRRAVFTFVAAETLAGLGALAINLYCAFRLARFRTHGGSLTRAAFLSARNDALANIAIIAAGLATAATLSA